MCPKEWCLLKAEETGDVNYLTMANMWEKMLANNTSDKIKKLLLPD